MPLSNIGKILIAAGLLLAGAGILLLLLGRSSIPFGRLPGDLVVTKKNVTIFAPFTTMIIVSVVLTVVLNIISRWMK